jgi:hypothetical protein
MVVASTNNYSPYGMACMQCNDNLVAGCPDFCWKREGRHCRETILRGLYLRFNRSRWSIFVGVSDKCSLEDG